MWTINEAVDYIQELEPLIRGFNYCTALGGSVLHKGFSRNDLDVYLMPIIEEDKDTKTVKPYDTKGIVDFLINIRAEPATDSLNYLGSEFRTIFKYYTPGGKRIDFFLYL